ncbi:unnamed protein product [Orchesella dallaii]|uniref:Uncharacterized protein n=1 Tax=Orchesella dallaii TaxID=48710 RepID=A0ABP1RWW4_9HEXA
MQFVYNWKIIASLIALNLIAIVTANGKCATLYNSRSYQGTPLSLQDGSKYPNLRYMRFVPNSIRVTQGCVLTIFDSYGNKQTTDRDVENLGWSPHRTLDASCCYCGGCSEAVSTLGSLCARMYENARCDSCAGFRLDMKSGDGAKNFGPLNNRMTSVAIRPGCTLTVYSTESYDGWRFNFTESTNMMGNNWYKQVSSAVCGCNDAGPGPNPYLSTRPPITLPTIQTRPPMTFPTVATSRPTFYTYPTTKWPPMTLPTVPTRPPMTLPTVPTRPPITLPTVPYTTKAPITLPTVPTTRPPMTLPTVPTTRAPITLPTVPTTRAPITLPTVPTTTPDDYSYEDWNGEGESEDLSTTKSTTTTARVITLPTVPAFSESTEFDLDFKSGETDEPVDSDEDDTWGMSNEEESTTTKVMTTTTTTTPKPTTVPTFSESTEFDLDFKSEETDEPFDSDEDDTWGMSNEEEATTAKVMTTTTTTTPKPTTTSTTTPKPTTTEASLWPSATEEEEDDFYDW